MCHLNIFKLYFIYLSSVSVCYDARTGQGASCRALAHFSHRVGPRYGIQVIRLGGRSSYPRSHLASPVFFKVDKGLIVNKWTFPVVRVQNRYCLRTCVCIWM